MAATASRASIPRSISVMPCICLTRSRTEFTAMFGGENPMVDASPVRMMSPSDFFTVLPTMTTCPRRSSWPSVIRCCRARRIAERRRDTQQLVSCRYTPELGSGCFGIELAPHVSRSPSIVLCWAVWCGKTEKKENSEKKTGTYWRFVRFDVCVFVMGGRVAPFVWAVRVYAMRQQFTGNNGARW